MSREPLRNAAMNRIMLAGIAILGSMNAAAPAVAAHRHASRYVQSHAERHWTGGGAHVEEVVPNTGAVRAGIRPGQRLLRYRFPCCREQRTRALARHCPRRKTPAPQGIDRPTPHPGLVWQHRAPQGTRARSHGGQVGVDAVCAGSRLRVIPPVSLAASVGIRYRVRPHRRTASSKLPRSVTA